ncbi:acetylornithine aminotransferase [Corynebacterium pseudotuberculosis]|uniref:acetylornithine transaminase n=1 Tax=Corynebacterium pseudotuberculosis TaxID=1719 RepID=UPI000737B1C0|nr:acetylornithine transaminase [Corynebacterium pseudotuberculosis]ALU22050.1 acetylornithine aminotransferase [Corynebacterium pseudotuberculosis]ANH24388.1 Acetylornithine aminotransferase [Corynebacterium pseudotuberculosis]
MQKENTRHAEKHAEYHSAQAKWPDVLMNTYGTPTLELVDGDGAIVVDSLGREHIDLLAGIAVNSLGYGHPAITEAVTAQVQSFSHVSNLFASAPVVNAAEKIIQRFSQYQPHSEAVASDSRVFFCNSGTEANEAAFKLARLSGRSRILAAQHGFHGRTMGALALTGQPEKQLPFEPLPAGVEFYPYGDVDYLRKLVDVNPQNVAAIFLEPIQGETGVIPAPSGFLQEVRSLCTNNGILMVVDEVQTGVGRTGDFSAFQHEGVLPDVVTMAKGLGGGLPIGACVAHGKAKDLFVPGTHGTTFGGNPVACAAAGAVLSVIEEDFVTNVRVKGKLLKDKLSDLKFVDHVRGRGLMLGVVLKQPVAKVAAQRAAEFGLILNAPSEFVLRITPPLVITDEQIADAVDRIERLLDFLTTPTQ